MCRLNGARKPCVGIAQQVAALMAPGKHLLKLLNGGDDRGRGAAKKKQVPKLRNGCGDQEKPNNTKNVEIAQRLWRHPIEHTDDSPRISHSPLGRIRKKGGHIQTSNCSEGCGNQGREKKEMWRPRGSETINVLSLRNGCGDSGDEQTTDMLEVRQG